MAENGAPRIRLGMVGGGTGAFIGYVHRIAARLDGDYELVAGALSSDPRWPANPAAISASPRTASTPATRRWRPRSRSAGRHPGVSIVTPNHMHYGPAKAFLEAGIHVICDKPLTSTLEDARALAAIKPKKGAKFLLTHNYTGYPLVRQARELVKSRRAGQDPRGAGRVSAGLADERAVHNKQADWRTDPKRSGAGGAIGDIGTHAYNLARFVTGLKTEAVSADLTSFVKGRKLDDNVHIMLRFQGGARGMLWASQVAVGNENGLQLRVYGEKAGLEWRQDNPNHMWFTEFGKPKQMLTRGGSISATRRRR
jgi:predicted dehydrogenase